MQDYTAEASVSTGNRVIIDPPPRLHLERFYPQLIFHFIALILPGAGYWLGKRIFKNDPASEGKL